MIRIRNRFPVKSEFAKNAITLSIGTSIAQAFPMLFYPVLGRIFLVSDFGLLATLTSITAILTVLSTAKYENTVLIADSKNDAANIVGLVLLLSFTVLLVSLIVLQLLSDQLGGWLNEPALKKWLYICPISAYAIVIYNCYNEWCVRNKYFIVLSSNKIVNSAATTLSKLFLGFVKISGNGLVVGDLIGRIISAGSCVFKALQKDKSEFLHLSFRRMRHLAGRYKEFPKYNLPDQLLMTIGVSLPVLLIGVYLNSFVFPILCFRLNILFLYG